MSTCSSPACSRSVLFVIDQLTELGGAERMMFALAKGLSLEGYRVTVVTLRGDPSAEAYKFASEIIVLATPSCLSRHGLSTLRRLRTIIHERNVCLVQTYFESADLFGAVASRIAGVRAICSSRRDMGFLRTRKHNLLYRILTPFYGHVFAVSTKVAKWHQQKDGIAAGKMSVVHNGVALERYHPSGGNGKARHSMGVCENAFLITTVANVNPWKGLDIFLEAAAIVHGTYSNTVFAIAGDWTDPVHLEALRSMVERLDLTQCVHFLGRVEDVPSLLQDSDLFALTSRSEGFPNAVIEAMAAGLPVVATHVGGTSEAVVDGVTGYLVPNENYDAAAKHMIELLQDEKLRARMGDAAREVVARDFSIQSMVDRHTEVYDALLAK